MKRTLVLRNLGFPFRINTLSSVTMKAPPARHEFTIREVCHLFDVSESTMRRMLAAGDFPKADLNRGAKDLWSFRTVAGQLSLKVYEETVRHTEALRELDKLDAEISKVSRRVLGDTALHQIVRVPWYLRLLQAIRDRLRVS